MDNATSELSDCSPSVFKVATERDVGYVSLVESTVKARTRTSSSSAVDARERAGSVAGAGYVSLLADPSEPKVSLYIVSARAKPSGAPLRVYGGQCHCGAVKFRVHAPQHLVSWACNCSVCIMKKNTHFVVPRAQFKLLPPVLERDRAHGGDALDYVQAALAAQRSGDAAASMHPLHWGRPPAAADVAAWTWHNRAADSPDAPRCALCALRVCGVLRVTPMLTRFPFPACQRAGGAARLFEHIHVRFTNGEAYLL